MYYYTNSTEKAVLAEIDLLKLNSLNGRRGCLKTIIDNLEPLMMFDKDIDTKIKLKQNIHQHKLCLLTNKYKEDAIRKFYDDSRRADAETYRRKILKRLN